MRHRLAALLATVAGLASAAPAAAYLAQNGYVVETVDAVQFRVMPKGGLGVSDGWCAAGDYVIRALDLPGNTRIWRISPVPRRAGQVLVFSLSSEGAFGETGLMQLGGAGDGSMSAVAAQQICWAIGEQIGRW